MTKYSAALSLVVLFLIGCADHDGVNNPASSTYHTLRYTGSSDAIPTQFTELAVDEIVTDEKSGASYAVRGSIACDFSKNESDYTLTTVASLTVSKEPDGKEYTGHISSNYVDKGPVSSEIQLTRSYKLPGLPPGSYLLVQFRIAGQPTIEGMSIRVNADESGIEFE